MTKYRLPAPRRRRLPRVPASTLLLPSLLFACSELEEAADPSPRAAVSAPPAAAAHELGMTPLALDERGVPRLLRAAGAPPAPAATATESALAHLGRLSPAWGVARAALPAFEGIGEVPAPNATIARVRQTLDGLPIAGGELRVMVRAGGELVAANGTLISADTPRQPAAFPIDDAEAVARAVAHNYGRPFAPAALATQSLRPGGERLIRGRDGDLDVQLARAQKVWQPTGTALVPAWVVEAYASGAGTTNGDAFRTVLTADGGRVISHESLVADAAFTYRVYAEPSGEFHPLDGPVADYSPHPTGMPTGQFPAYLGSSLVTVDGTNHPKDAAAPDPWLPDSATETSGNNVQTYSDVNPPSGFSAGDFHAAATGARTFDHAFDLNTSALASQTQQMAAITSAFYGINWLHDFWYDAGFTEAAGNAQADNYGRGGKAGDAMLAEAQDNAPLSLNNANMATPEDGMPPRMQIFVWTGKEDRKLTIQPANRTPDTATATFCPLSFDTMGELALAVDDTAPAGDGCTPLTNNVTGKMVLVDRGTCTYRQKALNIQQAGGVGMIVANHTAAVPPPGMANDPAITTPITISCLSVTLEEGNQLKTELATGPVTGTAHRAVPLLDGGLDSTLLAHEFGHYLHHRLQSCNTRWCSAISEGWGDFLALLLMMREGDNYDGAYPFSIYSTQGFTTDPAYYGIRRAPYSVNPAINSLSYRHMADGVTLPTSHPFRVIGNNAEVHNAGEIWAQTMMEVYVALLKAGPSFDAARAKMARYVVAGLLMAPKDATPTETRDALVAVAAPEDQPIMLAAFARRGMGSCAVTPARGSSTFVGIVESAEIKGRAAPGEIAYDARTHGCDGDDVLDADETATLSLPISNSGNLPLASVRVSVISATPGLTVMSEPVTIESFAPGASQPLTVEVKLDKRAAGALAGELTVKIEAAGSCAEVLDVPFKVRLNVDDVPAASATDTFDATSIWQPTGASSWAQVESEESPLDRQWHGTDDSVQTDGSLESPIVTASDAAPLVVTFSHRYKFEFDTMPWDGGVIEFSTDGGTKWLDVTTLGVLPGYTHTLASTSGNPLGGRMAFANQNAAYPAMDTVTLDFGTQLAGMDVRLRFRVGTDGAAGGPGWDIDDVAFAGITGKPFPAQVPDPTVCGETGDGSGCCDAGPLRRGNLALVLGVLALLVCPRRRRRR
ncbi:MAG TPA: M36 family metallopeptidase [Kofleriaceae bacterium]|nr:M36 family metallopeptidase [Kofleriaceae bacterium]